MGLLSFLPNPLSMLSGGGGGGGGSTSFSGGGAFNKSSESTSTTGSYNNTWTQDNDVTNQVDARIFDSRTTDNSITDNRAFDYRQWFDLNASQDNDTTITTSDSRDYRQWFDLNASQDNRVNDSRSWDNRVTLGDGAINTTGAVSVLDGGAIGQAFDFGQALARLFGGAQTTGAARAFDSADSLVSSNATVTRSAFDLAGNVADRAAAQSNALAGGAFDLVRQLGDAQTSFLRDVLGKTFNQQDSVSNLVATAYNDAKGRGAMTDTLLMVAVGAAALIAIVAIRK